MIEDDGEHVEPEPGHHRGDTGPRERGHRRQPHHAAGERDRVGPDPRCHRGAAHEAREAPMHGDVQGGVDRRAELGIEAPLGLGGGARAVHAHVPPAAAHHRQLAGLAPAVERFPQRRPGRERRAQRTQERGVSAQRLGQDAAGRCRRQPAERVGRTQRGGGDEESRQFGQRGGVVQPHHGVARGPRCRQRRVEVGRAQEGRHGDAEDPGAHGGQDCAEGDGPARDPEPGGLDVVGGDEVEGGLRDHPPSSRRTRGSTSLSARRRSSTKSISVQGVPVTSTHPTWRCGASR